jgi:hypothetical protein
MQLYSVNNITGGTDSQGEVTVRLKKDGRIVNGAGADTDIVVASAKAYINALNKLHSKLERVCGRRSAFRQVDLRARRRDGAGYSTIAWYTRFFTSRR